MSDYIYVNGELYHWGIKGMKWGVRRFQNKDGTRTPAGKKRYSEKSAEKHESLVNEYKKAGYSDKEAERRAKGYERAKTALKIAGGLALTAAVAYGAYKYYDNNIDRFIPPNKAIQTVHRGDIQDRIKPGNPFYASYTKADNTIYASKVFGHFTDESNITRMFTKDGIKVASEKSSNKIFQELLSTNSEFSNYCKEIEKLGDATSRGSYFKTPYRRFNYSLVLRNDSETLDRLGLKGLDHDKAHKIFYDELRKRGYGAIVDVNDSKNEGFTHTPVIVFDNAVKHVISTTKATPEDLGGKRLAAGMAWSQLRRTINDPLNDPNLQLAGMGYLAGVGIVANDKLTRKQRATYIENYKTQHPNTTKSDAAIGEMFDVERIY